MTEKHLKNMALTERMEQLMAQPKQAPSTEQPPPATPQPENEEEAYEAFLQRLESAKQKQVAGFESSYSFLDKRMQILQSATEKAALSGKFNPAGLFSEDIDAEDQQFVLTSLAPDCIIESTSKVEWLLSPGKRLQILAAMIKEDRLKEGLRQSLPKPDRFGTQLRRVLASPGSLRPDRMNQEDLQALMKVLETLQGLEIPKPTMEEVKPFIQSGTALSDYSLLSSNFVGRVDELVKLYQFLESPSQSSWEGLVVTGMGGVGKSTLLAKFTSEVMEQSRATVVIIDFDRPGMNPADTGWLEMEMARQVGDLYPASRQVLSSMRQELQQKQAAYGAESVRESLHVYKMLVDAVGNILRDDTSGKKPLLLILDTVEEAAQRSLTRPLINWLFEVSYLLNHPLKVIFSGRLYEHQLEEFKANPQVLQIFEIEAFDKNIARKFLRLQGLDRHTAWRLVDLEMMPLRPLELKLMARLISEGSTSLEELEKDLQGSSGNQSTNELFSGLVYRRVLMRIGDPLVRTIAYPGLVLRFVTPEIVREVLAPALELGEIGEEQSEKIVDDLRSYGWLAYEQDGALWHSKDLRRTMLRLMILQEPEKVKRIREEAIEFFAKKDDAAARAENIYHYLMLPAKPGDLEVLDLNPLQAAYEFIEPDIPDLPRTAAVLLQFAGTGKINESDMEFLPDKFFLMAYDELCARLVRARRYRKAYECYQRKQKIDKDKPSARFYLLSWECDLLFAIADWNILLSEYMDNYRFNERYASPEMMAGARELPLLRAIIAPDKVQPQEIKSEWIIKFSDVPEYYGAINISRLIYALACLNAKGKISPGIRQDLGYFFHKGKRSGRPLLMEKSLLISGLVAKGELLTHYNLHISSLKLDQSWMERLKARAYLADRSLVQRFTDIMNRSNAWESAGFLSKISNENIDLPISLQTLDRKTVYDIVRGPDPIFRDPCRYAVLDAFTTHEHYRELAGYIQQNINIKLTDLEPEQFATRMMQDAETALEIFIEIIDRTWALGDFLRLLHKNKPEAKKIKQVLEVYENWENSFRQLVLGDGRI